MLHCGSLSLASNLIHSATPYHWLQRNLVGSSRGTTSATRGMVQGNDGVKRGRKRWSGPRGPETKRRPRGNLHDAQRFRGSQARI
jgi:hypothetical protein